ncbi:MAG: accessory Sec system glycosyltransferase Asp1 [Streptococcus sp.]
MRSCPQLLLLAYQPHLRYFLHRHDVLEVGHSHL